MSGCSVLTKLDCSATHLTSLDMSNCTTLTELDYSFSSLISLDMASLERLD